MARKIGRYEIYDKIGSGAFGEVYRGHDPEVKRPVAVKVLSTRGDADSLARFRREAAAAGNLHHPNIVTIYDSGENDGVPFIVMELVDGLDLQKHAAACPLSILERAEIMYQAAEGLQYAHKHGIVHRDVKPANIMVLADGSVKILDFGIARFNQQTERHTRTGFMVGSIRYMSPEQFLDSAVDALSDIWAYGVVYYELLTGRHPFEANDNASLMYKVTRVDPAPPRSLCQDIPEGLEQIVHRTLARDRELRYQSLYDLQLDALPVLMELRRQRAVALIGDARAQFEAGRLEDAMTTTRRILELDPAMVEARQLRDQITRQTQQSKVRPRVDSLLKSAEQALTGRRYAEAVESLGAALRLDPNDSGIRGRLETAQRRSERSERASELVTQAEHDFRQREFAAALRLCAEALRIDEHHPQGLHLMESIQQEMSSQERRRRREEGLEKAHGLLTIQSFDEVFAVIESLRAEFPGDAQVEQFAALAAALRDERDKRNRLRDEMQAARGLLREGRLAEAVERLQPLRGDFAGDRQFVELLNFAEGELRRQSKDQDISRLVEKAKQALAEARFDDGLQLLNQGLQSYPGDGTLTRQFQTLLAAKNTAEKAQVIAEALARGEELRNQGRPGEALDLLDTTTGRYGTEPALLRFRRQLEVEQQRLEETEVVRDTVRRSEELLRQRNFAQAIALVQAALGKYPNSSELQVTQARVRAFQAESEAQDKSPKQDKSPNENQLAADTAQFDSLLKTDQIDAATQVLERSKLLFGNDPRLAPLQERLAAAMAGKRRDDIRRLCSEARELMSRAWYEEAMKLLESGAVRFPGAEEFARLRAEAEAGRRKALRTKAIQQALAEVASLVEKGQTETALRTLDEKQRLYPDSRELADQAERLRRQRIQQRNRRGLIITAAASVAVALLAIAGWNFRGRPAPDTAPPAFWKYDLVDGVRGEAYMDMLNAHAGAKPLTYSLVQGTLPAGLDLDPREGVIHGIPSSAGASTFLAQVTDSLGRSAQQQFVLTVARPDDSDSNAAAGLAVGNAGKQWTTVRGAEFSEFLRASGGSPPVVWSIAKGSLPPGLSLASKYGRVRGIAVKDGVFAFKAKATDSAGHTAEGGFTITVKPKS